MQTCGVFAWNRRPLGFYARLQPSPDALARYAGHFVKNHALNGLRPSRDWYGKQPYVPPQTPVVAVQPAAKTVQGNKSGGSRVKAAFAVLAKAVVSAVLPNSTDEEDETLCCEDPETLRKRAAACWNRLPQPA